MLFPRFSKALILFAIAVAVALLSHSAPAQTTELVSLDSQGNQANANCFVIAISSDGQHVLFCSSANNLVPGDTNGARDIFVQDRQTGLCERLSVNSIGWEGNDDSWYGDISANGNIAVFYSYATNFHSNDHNGDSDVFLRDRQAGTLTCLSLNSTGQTGNGFSGAPSLSEDGRFVAFESLAWDLVSSDTNYEGDVFVHDRQTGQTTLVSVDSLGNQGNGRSRAGDISADGRFVAFTSESDNLVPNDNNGEWDAFVHDRQTGETERISVNSYGIEGDGSTSGVSISGDGKMVAFTSVATNFDPNDNNQYFDVFVHDRQSGRTRCINLNRYGNTPLAGAGLGEISINGRYVTFNSKADDLIPGDSNLFEDVFVHDLQTAQIDRVSLNSNGNEGNSRSNTPRISQDGSFIAFTSFASNLVPGDSNGFVDCFVHDYRNSMADTIHLNGPNTIAVGSTLTLQWTDAPNLYPYWLIRSMNLNGTTVGWRAHKIDLGRPRWLLATGMNSSVGKGFYSSTPIPAGAIGHALHFEVISRASDGFFYDSNVQTVTVQ